jgi:hypothetical protein
MIGGPKMVLHAGEYVLTARDVDMLGGQEALREFRLALGDHGDSAI